MIEEENKMTFCLLKTGIGAYLYKTPWALEKILPFSIGASAGASQ